ncbi:hypothetical protein [Sphingomonas sp.]|uniref:hypothetical protein n=1 Tax=Sphingomonas sp. TaxID=28214 RepID=UPI003F6FABB7
MTPDHASTFAKDQVRRASITQDRQTIALDKRYEPVVRCERVEKLPQPIRCPARGRGDAGDERGVVHSARIGVKLDTWS